MDLHLRPFWDTVKRLPHPLVVVFLMFCSLPALAQHGDLDPIFVSASGADGIVHSVVEIGNGKMLIAGAFSHYGNTPRKGVAVLNPDGSLDSSFDPGSGFDGIVYQAIRAPSGGFLVVGDFLQYNGTAVGKLVMIQANGTLNSGFQTGSGADGPIYAVAATGSGEWLIGGKFENFGGQARKNFVMLNSNGSLGRASWPTANGTVRSITPETGSYSYNFLLTGDFTAIGSSSGLSGIAKIDSLGYPDYRFRPTAKGGTVSSVAYITSSYSSGQVAFLAGDFKGIGELSKGYIATVDQYGDADPFFNIHPNGRVLALSVDATGREAVIAGAFTEVNGIPMKGVARISKREIYQSGYGYRDRWEVDQNFGGPDGPNGAVHTLLRDSKGRYLLGGEFTQVGGSESQRVARLLSKFGLSLPAMPSGLAAEPLSGGSIRLSWEAAGNAAIYRLERSPSGTGEWTTSSPISSTSYVSSGLEPETTYDFRIRAENANGVSGFSEAISSVTTVMWTGPGSLLEGTAGVAFATGSISDTAVQPDGKILIAGSFTQVLGFERKCVARLNTDRTLDLGFDPGNLLDYSADKVATAPDGKIYVVSNNFSTALGLRGYEILRLNSDGSYDPTFTPPKSAYDINCVDVDLQGNVLLGLSTQTFGEQQTGSLVRLRPDGSVDIGFTVRTDASVYSLSRHPDYQLVAGGSFNNVNGAVRRNILRCDPAGTLDVAVGNAWYMSTIYAVEALPDGSILIAGFFSSVYGESRSRVAKLRSDGTVDLSFVPPEIDSGVSEIEVLYGGKILIAGAFSNVGDKYMPRIACLDSTGAPDPDFRIGAGPNSSVNSISMASDGSIIVAGNFSSYDLEDNRHIAFLKGYTPASSPVAPALVNGVVGSGFLELSWNSQGTEFGYFVETSTNGTDAWSEVAQLSRDAASFSTTGLPSGTTRYFRIRASNGFGTSGYSNVISATTWTNFQRWNVDNGFVFDTPVDADQDGDSMGQLMEYGLGLDPAKVDSAGALSTQMIGGNLVLTYFPSKPELVYQVEVSENLSDWTTEGVSIYHGNFSMGWAPVVEPQRFLRLSITER